MIKKHWAAIVLAIIFGFLLAVGRLSLVPQNEGWAGIYNQPNDDEPYYLLRIRETTEGHATAASPYLFEHKNDRPVIPWVSEWLLGRLWLVSGLSLVVFGILFGGILKAAAFLITYGFWYALTRRRLLALSGVVFFYGIFFWSKFNTPISPQVHWLFFLATVSALWVWWKKPQWSSAALVTILFGSLFYVYFYHWTFLVVWLMCLPLCAWWQKEKIVWRQWGVILGGGFLLGAPALYQTIMTARLPTYAAALTRVGALQTHWPSGALNIILPLLCLSALWWLRRHHEARGTEWLWFLAGTVALLSTANQQIITGTNVLFSSHYLLATIFLTVSIFLVVTEKYIAKISPRQFNGGASGVLLLLLIFMGQKALCSWPAQTTLNAAEKNTERYAPLFVWLEKNAATDAVVLANQTISELIPLYSGQNVFYAPMTLSSLISDAERQERFWWNNYTLSPNTAAITAHETDLWGYYFMSAAAARKTQNKLRHLLWLPTDNSPVIPAEKIAAAAALGKTVQAQPYEQLNKKYRVDYLVVDQTTDKNPAPQIFSQPLWSANNIALYLWPK